MAKEKKNDEGTPFEDKLFIVEYACVKSIMTCSVAEGVVKPYVWAGDYKFEYTVWEKVCGEKRVSNTLDMALSKALTLALLQQKTVVI